MGIGNENLRRAKDSKNDEFYTRLSDVSNELCHYTEHFKSKVVYCNCDDPTLSAFWEYFHLNFSVLGLKRLVSTHYDISKPTYRFVYDGGNDTDIADGVRTLLTGNGDFRSAECVSLLDECDIVVTNPPFSLFREYVTQLMEHGKKFLIIGNMNAITYKEIFPLIKDARLWLGVSLSGTKCSFAVPASYTGRNVYYENGRRMAKVNNAMWFTNLDHKKRHERLALWKKYTPESYPTYDNYNGVNVDRCDEIPVDYDGVCGVPITYLYRHNPEQFEIVAFRKGDDGKDLVYTKDGKKVQPYFRILIKRKDGCL